LVYRKYRTHWTGNKRVPIKTGCENPEDHESLISVYLVGSISMVRIHLRTISVVLVYTYSHTVRKSIRLIRLTRAHSAIFSLRRNLETITLFRLERSSLSPHNVRDNNLYLYVSAARLLSH